jgi:hypothetical protein
MFPVGNAVEKNFPPQNPTEIAAIPIGDTVMNGTDVVDENKIRKSPILYHPEYIMYYVEEGQYFEIFTSLTTGTATNPLNEITDSSISTNGTAKGFKGPGVLRVEGNKLVINPPNTFVWGYKIPYTVAVKTSTGIDIKQANKTIKSVTEKDISNDTIPHQYMTLDEFKEWYNDSEVGDNTSVDYALSNFSDGRNMVPPDKLKTYFGESVVKYMEDHPADIPVMAYDASQNQKVIGSSSTGMDYYEDLDNNARVENAQSFINAWNNTVIPPHTVAVGSNKVYYLSVYDPNPNATVKWASHGTCPPGRALRDSVLDAGFDLPTGMTMDYKDVISNYADLVTGIRVENNGDYPVKIIMWSDGDDGSLSVIYAQVIQLLP